MIAIITGDITNSKKNKPKTWLAHLRKVLAKYGTSPKQWEIYRGDSFQLETKPELALEAAMLIRTAIKQTENTDVRLAIGIGDKTYNAQKLTQSNGSAFVYSGELFDDLKKNKMAIRTNHEPVDETLNVMVQLAALQIDKWTTNTSKVVHTTLLFPELNQEKLAKKLKTTQANISQTLKRAGYDEVSLLMKYYKKTIQSL